MAEAPLKVQRGQVVWTNVRNIGWVEGSVAWVQDSRFGIAFRDEIDPRIARAPSQGGEVPEFTVAGAAGPSASQVFERASGEPLTKGLSGFYTIHEENLAKLGAEALGSLHARGYLQPIYMVIASMSKLRDLIERKNKRHAGQR